jgi:hypothetical protein
VVWRPRGSSLPTPLANALVRPDFQVSECDNQYEAVARLCGAKETVARTVLLIVEPKMLPETAEVGAVIDRYAPTTTLWVFETEPAPQIRAVTSADRAAWTASRPAPATPTPSRAGPALNPAVRAITDDAVTTTRVKMSQPPRLRLAGDSPAAAVASPPAAELKVAPAEPTQPPTPLTLRGLGADGPGIPPVPSGKSGHLLSDEELAMLLAPDPGKGNY